MFRPSLPASPVLLAIASFSLWGLVALSSPLFFAGALVVWVLTFPFDRRRVLLHLYSSFWAATYVHACPLWRLRVTGRDRLPWRGAAVLVANHASLVDILVLFALYRPYKWVSKKEIFRLPFIGWNMTLNGYVPLVRGERDSIAVMMARCAALLAAGSPVLIFPEGTRSRDGRLQDFKDGAFRLAMEAGCPVIPIAVHGTASALPKHGVVLRQPMDAWVEVLEPLDPAAYPSLADLKEATRSVLAAAMGR